MKKIFLITILLSLLLSAEETTKYDLFKDTNKTLYITGGNIDESPKIGIGANYDRFSLEAIYKKKIDSDVKDLKSYFKNGNTIGLNFTYTLGEINENSKDSIFIANLNSNLKKPDLNVNYKLQNNLGFIKTIDSISKITNPRTVSIGFGNIVNINKTMYNNTISVLKKNAGSIKKKYGSIEEKDIIKKADYIENSGQIVLYFDKGGKN